MAGFLQGLGNPMGAGGGGLPPPPKSPLVEILEAQQGAAATEKLTADASKTSAAFYFTAAVENMIMATNPDERETGEQWPALPPGLNMAGDGRPLYHANSEPAAAWAIELARKSQDHVTLGVHAKALTTAYSASVAAGARVTAAETSMERLAQALQQATQSFEAQKEAENRAAQAGREKAEAESALALARAVPAGLAPDTHPVMVGGVLWYLSQRYALGFNPCVLLSCDIFPEHWRNVAAYCTELIEQTEELDESVLTDSAQRRDVQASTRFIMMGAILSIYTDHESFVLEQAAKEPTVADQLSRLVHVQGGNPARAAPIPLDLPFTRLSGALPLPRAFGSSTALLGAIGRHTKSAKRAIKKDPTNLAVKQAAAAMVRQYDALLANIVAFSGAPPVPPLAVAIACELKMKELETGVEAGLNSCRMKFRRHLKVVPLRASVDDIPSDLGRGLIMPTPTKKQRTGEDG